MADVCGDNRFEIIEAVKKRLIESTNITTSPKEMEVIDSLLLRMWQLGYLKDNNVKHATWVVSKKYKPWYTCSACEDCCVDGEWFNTISFDNLALNQLDVKGLVSDEVWDEIYMGDDGLDGHQTSCSMFVDLVERKFAKNSCSDKRYDLLDDAKDMYQFLKDNQ